MRAITALRAGIEFAVLSLGVRDIVVCGHSHCGAIQALMPQFFAGLLPTWQSGALAFALGTVAVSSAFYPASRAAAVDPVAALRYE